jgi:hypothetical protein
MKINKLLGILLIFTISCSTSMVGKQMPPANYPKVSPNLQHINLKLIEIELKTEIDRQVNTVTAKGMITVVEDELPPGTSDFNRINMKALLMDENYTVIREVSFNTPPGVHSFAPIPFEVTFPYDPAYRYVHFTGMVRFWH